VAHQIPDKIAKFLNAISKHAHVDNLSYNDTNLWCISYTFDLHTPYGVFAYEIYHNTCDFKHAPDGSYGWRLVGMRGGRQQRYHNPQWEFNMNGENT
jgi:hypothetical protein